MRVRVKNLENPSRNLIEKSVDPKSAGPMLIHNFFGSLV
jgi:hypothetical protein